MSNELFYPNKEIVVTLHPHKYNNKPTNPQTLSEEFSYCDTYYLRPEKLAQEILTGKTFVAAMIGENRDSDHIYASNCICLDFDGKMKFLEFESICESNKIMPSFCYSTFSSNKDSDGYPDRFRAIFHFEDLICTVDEGEIETTWTSKEHHFWKQIVDGFFYLFKNAPDKKCKDICHMFYGGKEVFYENYESIISTKLLDYQISCVIKEHEKSNNYSRDIKKYTPVCSSERKETYNSYKLLKNISIDSIKERCPLFKAIIDDQHWVYYAEGFKLLTNLNRISGAVKKILPYLKTFPNNQHHDWEYIHWHLKYKKYFPEQCDDKCTLYDTCCNSHVSLYNNLSHKIVQHTSIQTRSIDEIRVELNEKVTTYLDKNDYSINIIKSPTGSGKTHSIKNAIKQHVLEKNKSITIAVPTHLLKEEICQDLSELGIEHSCKPKFDKEELSEDIRHEWDLCLSIGYNKKKDKLLRENQNDIPYIRKYLLGCDNFRHPSWKVKITTISDIIQNRDSITSDILYIDEDVLPYLIEIKDEVHIEQIKLLYVNMKDKEDKIAPYIEMLYKELESNVNNIFIIDSENLYKEILLKNINKIRRYCLKKNIRINFEKILSSRCCFVSEHPNHGLLLSYAYQNDLPMRPLTIISSATVKEDIYRNIFNNKEITFHDTGHCEIKGNLIQIPHNSFSKYHYSKHMEKLLEAIPDFKEQLKEWSLITHKGMKKDFPYCEEKMHFGNILGYNHLSGNYICIIGTPNRPDHHYQFLHYIIYNEDLKQNKLTYCNTDNDHFSFKFYTFESKSMQNIQFHLIESELTQAIGRARLNLNDNNVIVFSNYPIPQAEFINFNKVEEYLVIDE